MVFLIVLGVIVVAGWLLYYTISSKVKDISRQFLGTEDVIKGLKQIENESNNTPLSISGGNIIYMPQILKDFPDYHQTTMEEKIKEFILLYLNCIEKRDIVGLNTLGVTSTVNEIIGSEITDLKDTNSIERFDNIRIHAIAVSRYTKTTELSTVRYQISLEYLGKVKKVQTKYEVDISYLFEDIDKDSFSIRCNHCGGSLIETSLVCDYCGTIVVRNITKVWVISNFKKIK